ncbi:ribokinase [Alkalibacter mobilis]|uniref:ribokinase n=1 Tax=Alkalibacter mobilis TaxID=2787712 RepID=UPI00189F3070|nr:ribokinase [Alkalibacter mobilis]MBF7095694.1 ribokinase [Alkalibacter mobilis]
MVKEPNILVVGSLNMDLIVSTNRFPSAGETVLGKDFSTAPGGKGANQAVQIGKLGTKVQMVGSIGKDIHGQEILESMKSAGVDVGFVTENVGSSTGIANILIHTDENGISENRIIVVPGANMEITPESIGFLKDKIKDYSIVVLQMEVPMSVNEAVIDMAYSAGVKVLLNPAPANKIENDVYGKLNYLVPNETEAELLTGVKIRQANGKIDFDKAKEASDLLLDRGVETVIITLGDSGAVCASKSGFEHFPSVKGVKAIDPTAAGDSFVGAFATEIAAGKPEAEAISFASRVAAITVSRAGAQPSLPTRKEVV